VILASVTVAKLGRSGSIGSRAFPELSGSAPGHSPLLPAAPQSPRARTASRPCWVHHPRALLTEP